MHVEISKDAIQFGPFFLIFTITLCMSSPPFYAHRTFTKMNPLEVAQRCWHEVSNLGFHGYLEALGTTKPTL